MALASIKQLAVRWISLQALVVITCLRNTKKSRKRRLHFIYESGADTVHCALIAFASFFFINAQEGSQWRWALPVEAHSGYQETYEKYYKNNVIVPLRWEMQVVSTTPRGSRK